MRLSARRDGRALVLVLTLALLPGCGLSLLRPETPPGPGVPRIASLRFEPEVIRAGETTQMSFYFEVGTADLHEGFVIERGISQFQFYQSLQAITVDLRAYHGQAAGTVEVPLRWTNEGIRWVEVYVVTRQGSTSNRITARLTVR
jgi:hypothetical protein